MCHSCWEQSPAYGVNYGLIEQRVCPCRPFSRLWFGAERASRQALITTVARVACSAFGVLTEVVEVRGSVDEAVKSPFAGSLGAVIELFAELGRELRSSGSSGSSASITIVRSEGFQTIAPTDDRAL
jgi:hypothetical protein